MENEFAIGRLGFTPVHPPGDGDTYSLRDGHKAMAEEPLTLDSIAVHNERIVLHVTVVARSERPTPDDAG